MRDILRGSVDQSVVIRILDDTTFLPETGVTDATSGLSLWYRCEGGLKVAITPASLAALTDAHADGGILHIGDGYYRLDLPDAAVATGHGVQVGGTVTGMFIEGCYAPLVAYNPQDTVRLGLTSIPNVVTGNTGAIITSGTGTAQLSTSSGRVLIQSGTGAGQLSFTSGILQVSVIQVNGANLATASSGHMPSDVRRWEGSSIQPAVFTAQMNGLFNDGANVKSISGDTTAADNLEALLDGTGGTITGGFTGNITGNVTGSVGSVAANVTVGTNNDKTGYTLTQAFPANFAALGINGSGHILTVATCQVNSDFVIPPTATENADALLKRDWSAVSGEAARSVLNAMRAIRNKSYRDGSYIRFTKENDSTIAWSVVASVDGDAQPIIGLTPA